MPQSCPLRRTLARSSGARARDRPCPGLQRHGRSSQFSGPAGSAGPQSAVSAGRSQRPRALGTAPTRSTAARVRCSESEPCRAAPGPRRCPAHLSRGAATAPGTGSVRVLLDGSGGTSLGGRPGRHLQAYEFGGIASSSPSARPGRTACPPKDARGPSRAGTRRRTRGHPLVGWVLDGSPNSALIAPPRQGNRRLRAPGDDQPLNPRRGSPRYEHRPLRTFWSCAVRPPRRTSPTAATFGIQRSGTHFVAVWPTGAAKWLGRKAGEVKHDERRVLAQPYVDPRLVDQHMLASLRTWRML